MPIERLELRPVAVELLAEPLAGRCVAVAVHAHVALECALQNLQRCGGDVVAAVAIPCCGWIHEAPRLTVIADYDDWGIWSPQRRVIVWSQ